ncbi:secreted immunoglobulin domain 4 [Chanos chanos]|uniref:secreted immunoglobulin domain 4 n=1 Tax=Chanos chanos TaxID=29144 RepID=UPI0011F3467E|nr:basement membrane-specific heparan sulfate proteoglycan core protein-like [Chanos chanos]
MGVCHAVFILCILLHTVWAQSPVLSIEPRGAAVRQGESASFRCRVVSGSQPVQLEWKKTNNQPLGDNVKVGPDGSVLTIANVRPANQGAYRCIATNAHGKATITASLTIKQSPKVRVTPASPVQVRVGGTVSLECHASGKPRPSIQWYKQEGGSERSLVATATTDTTATLKVVVTRQGEAGTYVCRAQNREGTDEGKVELMVEGGASVGTAPRASVSTTDLTAVEGQAVTMHCQATGSPTPVLSWSKLRAPLPWKHKVSGGTLTLTNVGRQDSGQYICNATNSAGYSEAYVQLEVDSPPYATILQDQVIARKGDSLRLQCLAHGSHPIQFRWTRVSGGSMSAGATTTKDGLLVIGQLKVTDSGTYKCATSNHVGSSEATAKVVVRA